MQTLAELDEEEIFATLKSEPVNILVVDDLPEKILVYKAVLEELGQNLITVSSGQEALKQVLRHEFAVILLDVNMPGMDGFETASLIRQRKKSAHTPIIFLTAFLDDISAAQGYASGAVDYLPTPVVPEVLRAKVQVFIELSQMRRQSALQAEERAMRKAAESSARRSDFLVRASEILTKSQNRGDILRSLVQLPISYLCDISMARFTDADTGRSQTEWAWEDMRASLDETREHHPVLSILDKAIQQVMKTGQPKLISSLPKLALVPESNECYDTDLAPLLSILPHIESVLIVSLTVRSKISGVLLLARTQSSPPYLLSDLSLVSDLASRASVALENTILMERIQEADRRKDEFLGMLAHELRNPLGPISNAVQLLRMLGGNEARLEQIRDIIDRQVTHMSRLIDDLLDATRLARGKILLRKERCNLGQIVYQTVEDYRSIFEASGLNLQVAVPAVAVWVDGDPTRLVQIIGNLLHNAHKFTNPGGMVIVEATLAADMRNVTVTVKDSGIGIDPAMLSYVFDVFRQAEQGLDRSRGGLGLGLALVKGLAELHNGDVSATSSGAGQGAEFTIHLPVAPMPMEIDTPPSQEAVPEKTQCRILIIEDNEDTAESARLLLSMEGYEVKAAYNGSDGLVLAMQFQPQVILCDIGLPGMDGYQVVRHIRQDSTLSSAYIIALTGYGRDEDQLQAQEAGFDLHMTKPIDYNLLRRALAHIPSRLQLK